MTQCIRKALRALIIFIVIFRANLSFAQTTPVNFELLSDSNNINDGQPFRLAIIASLEKDWHIYWKGSGESGQPTIINWESPDGFSTSSTSYPVPYKSEAFGLISHTYKNEAIFICEVTPPNNLNEDKEYVFRAIVDWQACKEACLPPTVTELEIKLTKGRGKEFPSSTKEIMFGSNPVVTDKDKAFWEAAKSGNLEVVQRLLGEGVDVDIYGSTVGVDFGCTALFWAAKHNHKGVVQFLIDKDAYIDAGEGMGGAPLHIAAWEGHSEIVELLISEGANTEAKDGTGETVLDSANEEIATLIRKSIDKKKPKQNSQGAKSKSYALIENAWKKSHLKLPILNAVALSDFGQLDISFNLTNEEINKIGKSPYFMPLDSSIIEEKEKQTIDVDGSILTIFATLEDPEFKPTENIEGFLVSSDRANSYWITTGQITKPKKQTIDESISEQVVIPSKDSPEGKAYINAIKELANGHKKETKSLSLMLLFAFLGGMILNLMPCVFPVLGIKVLGFVQQAGNDKSKIKYHGLSFAAGIIISLWALVSILFYIKSNGQSAGWGFQLQNPWFVWALIVIMYVFSLNLFGLFEIGTSLTSAGNKVQNKNGYLGSFLSGLLTVLVATPCTGPFMGPALALAISGPILQGYLLFTLLAIGLAFPYVILAYFPKLIEALPRPGKWMETFKQLMAFPLLLTVVWLLNILGKSTGLSTVIWILVGLIILTIGLWVYGKYSSQLSLSLKHKVFSYLALLICFLMFFKLSHQYIESNDSPKANAQFPKEIHGIKYQPFDPIIALNHVKNGENVFIDYTAVW